MCLLQKLLYSLKQSPRCWFQHLCEVLNRLGLVESCTDQSVFLSKQGSVQVYLCIYIDDIVIMLSSTEEITQLLQLMALDFLIRDLEDLKFFLGIEVDRIKEGHHLSQTQYLANLLRTCNMDNLKPAVIPIVLNFDLNAKSEPIP